MYVICVTGVTTVANDVLIALVCYLELIQIVTKRFEVITV